MARDELDRYYTPPEVAQVLVSTLRCLSPRRILEPSSGRGAFVDAVRKQWPEAQVTRIDMDPEILAEFNCSFQQYVQDHETYSNEIRYDLIVGNPPYREAQEHVQLALSLLAHGGTLAFLLRLGFLEGQKRSAWLRTYMPQSVTVLSKRPSFTGRGTDATAYGWFVWGAEPAEKTELDLL